MPSALNIIAGPVVAHSAIAAYQQLLPEILAYPESDVLHINLDVPLVVTTILGTIPEVQALRPRIVEELPKFDINQVDQLEFRVLALSHSHALYLGAAKPVLALPELIQVATKKREILYTEATTLVARGLLNPSTLDEVKRDTSHRSVAVDLQVIANGILAIYKTLQTKPLSSEAELNDALSIADQINYAIGYRDQGPQTVAETSAIRNRAYSWTLKTYGQVRRAVTYLRWDEGDSETIVPSPFAGKNYPSRKSEQAPDANQPTTTAPAQPAPTTAPTAPATPVPGFPVALPFPNKT